MRTLLLFYYVQVYKPNTNDCFDKISLLTVIVSCYGEFELYMLYFLQALDYIQCILIKSEKWTSK